jgi:Kdo2-lipid IVA lauroyltransferase/acyltransferase
MIWARVVNMIGRSVSPIRLARLGSLIGTLLYPIAGRRRNIALRNLTLCFPQLPAAQIEARAKAHFRAYGQAMLEHAFLWNGSKEAIREYVRFVDEHHWLEHRGKRPIIWLCPHFVGLDHVGVRITCDYHGASMYSTQSNASVDAMIRAGRERFGNATLFTRQEGIRPVIRELKKGVPFFYLPDMDFGARDSVFVPFFGVKAATITGLSRLCALTKAVVVPVIALQNTNGGYEAKFYPAWDNFPSGSDEADALRLNQFIEARVLEAPAQYLWTHRRFKTRPPGENGVYD